jgi:Ca2+-transporting ATPase
MTAFHAARSSDAAAAVGSDVGRGLEHADAASRLAREGLNRISGPRHARYSEILVRQAFDPLVGLLVAASVVSALIGDWLEAIAIGTIVALNGLLGFVQEARAERAVRALREASGRPARVVRAGSELAVPAEEIVRGDLLVLREGDRVEADGRILEEIGLAIDESILTGESLPSEKAVEPVPVDSPIGDRASMVYAGTWAVRGRGVALVTATGDATEQGLIATMTAAARPPRTPLQARLARLVSLAVIGGVVITLGMSAAMAARGASWEDAFLVGVSVAIAAVPEGLTAAVTIALALGAASMAARGAIVRRLSAVETLGETTVICTDKTGTLTENSLRAIACVPVNGVDEVELLAAAVLASGAVPLGAARWTGGDPIDTALIEAAALRNIGREGLLAGRRLLEEVPFDPSRRFSAAVYEERGGVRLVVKGAPETVLKAARSSGPEIDDLARQAADLASNGGRVLAIADRLAEATQEMPRVEDGGLRPLGLVAFEDPLRPAVLAAVAQARSAGIDVLMVTGDHAATANAVGRALGLAPAAIHARVDPARKLELVEALQRSGEVVAVTGDGINDTPALRQSDVGIAMGRSGTEAAREAAGLVLTDDDFSTIVAAIREGRRIGENIRTFVMFLLSANLGEVVLFAIAVGAGMGAPLTVVQVLAVNILTDGLPAIALSRDPARADVLVGAPRASGQLLSRARWLALSGLGLAVGLATLAAYAVGREVWPGAAQTMAFATLALAELMLAFSIRAPRRPAWRVPVTRLLGWSVAGSACVVALLVYTPALNDPFGTQALRWSQIGVVIMLALIPAVVAELAKAFSIRSYPQA